jgi:hypothetical protein
MAKKISYKRIQRARDWLHSEADESLNTFAGTIPPSLRKAAETFHLDPKDPYHAAILLRILAALVFTDGKKADRTTRLNGIRSVNSSWGTISTCFSRKSPG